MDLAWPDYLYRLDVGENMSKRLEEIKSLLNDNDLRSLWTRDEVRPSMEWLIRRVERLEFYLAGIEVEAGNHEDDSISSEWLMYQCKQALAEEE